MLHFMGRIVLNPVTRFKIHPCEYFGEVPLNDGMFLREKDNKNKEPESLDHYIG